MLCSEDLVQDFIQDLTVDANAIAYSRYISLIRKRLLWNITFHLRWLKLNIWDENPSGKWVFFSESKKREVYKRIWIWLEFCDVTIYLSLQKYHTGKAPPRLKQFPIMFCNGDFTPTENMLLVVQGNQTP
ncbi:hypothetical protein [Brunnivagina elsteri]|uniref:Uncharacterized protein n=1 Tax=Brunnivagina elsteri CCALA 953 TaxID=987040 RepID=A0A2A2TH72_9CYAN|nr:hypothetical protein [Calothrix elsteri]PAX52978.1 hypothetical protein CK510_16355 [Calothrix elsteri CCALA 953]